RLPLPKGSQQLGRGPLKGALGYLVGGARLQGNRAVEDAPLALYRRAQRQLTARLRLSELHRVHLRVHSTGGRESEMATWHFDVLHEEPSDQVVCVLEPGRREPVRRQYQTRPVDASVVQHVMSLQPASVLLVNAAY